MFEPQIANGVALLNVKRPGWAAKVNLRELDMADSFRCVAGQCGGWTSVSGWEEPTACGFFRPGNLSDEARNAFYAQITREWRWTIATLQGYRGPR